ncbi:MAG: GH116 family glycosyl hydrolase, partial [Candidatus Sulfotelmatobacter sp.]
IFNRPGKRRILPYSFAALWVKPEGSDANVRVVEGPPQAPFRGWEGYHRHSGEGLPHFRHTQFSATYPMAKIDFEDPELPVTVSLDAFNPFIPLNVDDSSLPIAILKYTIANRSPKPVDIALAFSLLNPVGYDGKAFLDGTDHPGFGNNLNTLVKENGVAGLHLTSEKYPHGHPLSGSMALLTSVSDFTARTSWESGAWWDFYQRWFDEFVADGRMRDSHPPQPSPEGKSDYCTLAPRAHLAPGASATITFVLAWSFPFRENYWHDDDEKLKGKILNNYYGTRFVTAWDAGAHAIRRLPELENKSRLFADTMLASTLPAYVIEAITSQASILRTNTCMLLAGKQFFAFEGCGDDQHNGWMNCSHVWNYEQALAFLFPELERSMRETDFLHEMRSDDSLAFRAMVPLDIKQWDFRPAADGQMGCILKLYREWQISGDDAFLRKLWPNAKRALEFSWKFWDADRDGVMEGEQHNTYDIEFFGGNPMMTTLYLGALKAAELMATGVGDTAAAASYREVREKGAKNIEQFWNGQYYFQKTTPVADIQPMEPYDDKNWKERVVRDGQLKYQFGPGCLSDQMLGQWFADLLGLDLGLKSERVQSSLHSIYRHNFKSEFWTHPNPQRIYALNDENGLVLCSWPNGGRPALPFVYSDEVWTGIEYQVAAHLIYRGMTDEGLAIANGISDRYDGVRRNPWDQIEWGHHYSRALASYSVLLALSGFRYSAVTKTATFQPRMDVAKFATFFAAGTGWGLYTQERFAGSLQATLACRHGEMTLRHLVLEEHAKLGPDVVVSGTLSGGRTFEASAIKEAAGIRAEFPVDVVLREGESLALRVISKSTGKSAQ